MPNQLRIVFTVILAGLLFLGGCTPSGNKNSNDQTYGQSDHQPSTNDTTKEPTTPIIGGELKLGVMNLPTWNPLKWEESNSQLSYIERLVYRGLFTYTPQLEWTGDLVKSYSLTPEEDGKQLFRMTLKENAKWQDGQPVTFEDIKFTLETYLDPYFYGAWKQNLSSISGTSSYRSGKKNEISGISLLDNGDIQLTLEQPTSSFFHALTAPILPAHQLKGKKLEEIQAMMQEGKVIGSGPFKLDSSRPNELHLLRGFKKEEGGSYLDGILIQQYDGDPQKLVQDRYDLLAIPPMQDPKKLEGFSNLDITQNIFYYLGFNVADPILAKPEVRKALSQAIDQKAIIDTLLYGSGEELSTIYPAHGWIMDSTIHDTGLNVESAKKTMETLGYSSAKPLSLTVHYANGVIMEHLVDLLNEQLKKINVTLVKKPLDNDEYYAYLFSGKPVQTFIHAWPFAKDPGIWWKLYGSYHDVSDLGLNILHYHSNAADSVLKELYATLPDISLKEKEIAFLKRMNIDLPLYPLFAPKQSYWVSPKLHGVEFNGDGWLTNVEEWWMEK